MGKINGCMLMVLVIALHATAEINGKDCPKGGLRIKQKCYLAVVGYFTWDEANATCAREGYERPAYVEDADIYHALLPYMRGVLAARSLSWDWFWTGRLFDTEVDEQKFLDGRVAEWSIWWPEYPQSGANRTRIGWCVDIDPADGDQGFFNDVPSTQLSALCLSDL